jgi:hypothetical protein
VVEEAERCIVAAEELDSCSLAEVISALLLGHPYRGLGLETGHRSSDGLLSRGCRHGNQRKKSVVELTLLQASWPRPEGVGLVLIVR